MVETQDTAEADRPICWGCDNALELHQPDKTMPDRLLGVCSQCSDWYVIQLGEEGFEALKLEPALLKRP